MIVQERLQAILALLQKRTRWSVEQLQSELKVSRSTLRRDLIELEHLGEAVRRRGLVMHAGHVKGEPSFDRRRGRRVEQKKDIARIAVGLVPANACVYLDAGTTALEVGRRLLKRADLRLYTHSIRLLAIASEAQASIVCVGGEYRRVSDAVVGGLTAAWLDHLQFDIAFIAASGCEESGLSTTELSEMAVKQQILQRARRRVLVADSEKWTKPAAVRFADWASLTDVVSDAELPEPARQFIRGQGIELFVA